MNFHDDFLFFAKLQREISPNSVSCMVLCKKLADDPVSGWVLMLINLEFIIFSLVISLTILAINIHVCGVIELVLRLIFTDGFGLGSQSGYRRPSQRWVQYRLRIRM